MTVVELDDDSKATIAAAGRPRKFAAGEYVCGEGDHGRSLFLVVSGVLEARKRLSPLYCKPLRQFGADALFGEISFLGISDRTADIVAMGDCEVVEMDREEFDALKKSAPATALKILSAIAATLASGLKNTNDELRNALLCTIEGLETQE